MRPAPADAALRTMLAGEEVALLPSRGLWWESQRTLFVADVHLGKPAAFRAMGIPVPEAASRADLQRLGALVDALGAHRLVILGDLLHARQGRTPETIEGFIDWRAGRAAVEVLLVRGNHDRSAGDPPEAWGVRCVDGPHALGPFVLRHEPATDERGYVLCGHIHPAVRLHGAGASSLRAPCFWLGARVGVLPSFGSFTGAKAIAPVAGDRVFVVGDGCVAEARGQAR